MLWIFLYYHHDSVTVFFVVSGSYIDRMMISFRRIAGWLLGLVGLGLCLLILPNLVFMLSSQSCRFVNENVPCCGRYLKPLLWNIFLLALFVLQHSGMSSDIGKRALSQVGFGDPLHHPVYVICSCGVLYLIVFHMARLPGPPLWYFDVDEYPTLWLAVFILHCVMWFVIIAGAVAAEPMKFVGLRQLRSDDVQQKDPAQPVDERMYSRHVGLVAFVIILWVHMAMSVERFLLATFWTLYIFFGHRLSPSAMYVMQIEKQS